jgi:hypothetical protein
MQFIGTKILHFKPMQILRRLLAPQNGSSHEFFRKLLSPACADRKVGATAVDAVLNGGMTMSCYQLKPFRIPDSR